MLPALQENTPLVPIVYSLPESLEILESHTQHRGTVRLMLRKGIMQLQQLYAYEQTKMQMFKEMNYADITEEMWNQTVALSWRWHRNRPKNPDRGYSPMSNTQLAELKKILLGLDARVKYVWIDYTCAAQKMVHEGPGMTEIMRSRLYYARARRMISLPSMVVLPEQNSLMPLLAGGVRALGQMMQSRVAQPHSRKDLQIVKDELSALMSKTVLCKRDYFYRAWPLAERMARSCRDEWLEHWMPLNLWIGVLGDLLWMSARGDDDAKFPWGIFEEDHQRAMVDALHRCRVVGKRVEQVSKRQSQEESVEYREHSRTAPDIDEAVASFFMAGYKAWQTPLYEQNPTVDWLCEYMTDSAQVNVVATDWRDTVWSVYGTFVAKPLFYNNVSEAVSLLCRVADIEMNDTTWVKLGLLDGRAKPKSEASSKLLVHHQSTAYKEISHISHHGGAALALERIRTLQAIKDRVTKADATEADVKEGLSDLMNELTAEQINSDEGHMRNAIALGLQGLMQQYRDSEDVQLLCCLCLKEIVPTDSGCRMARKHSLLDRLHAILVSHSGNRSLVEEALCLIDTVSGSPVIMHGLQTTMGELLGTLQTLAQKHADAELIQQLLWSVIVNLCRFHDIRAENLKLGLLPNLQQAMQCHISCAHLQACCCKFLTHLAKGSKMPNPEDSTQDPSIGSRCMQEVLARDVLSDLMATMSYHRSETDLLMSALKAIKAVSQYPLLLKRVSDLMMLAVIKEAMESHQEADDLLVLACDAVASISQELDEACREAHRIGLVPLLNGIATRGGRDSMQDEPALVVGALKALRPLCRIPEARAHASLLQPSLTELMMQSKSGTIERCSWEVMQALSPEQQTAETAREPFIEKTVIERFSI